ncbi:hypothetical protein GLP59_10600 [Sulfitobacter sp. M220]|uniref:hypothetical protein n=1 Tax=Sulfitobacter sp. M220 TaxID=2675333 RepID=UPI001F1AD4E1|nr:hypothetical protein [Sulfitobacter sp. M220]MCF7778089.1 hypothetical protein [Sulfitobacter sp. M220]
MNDCIQANSVGPVYLAMLPIVQAGFDQFTINDQTYAIAATVGDVSVPGLPRPAITMMGADGTVSFNALNHSGLLQALVTDRSGDPLPFRKMYMVSGTSAKAAGDCQRLHARYQHFLTGGGDILPSD